MSYKEELVLIKSKKWIYKVYKENIDGVIGYFIEFNDGSFIIGNVLGSYFDYSMFVNGKIQSLQNDNVNSFAKDFVFYLNSVFVNGKISKSFVDILYDNFKKVCYEGMTKKQLYEEMLKAASNEDFETAMVLKNKIEQYEI